MADETAGMRRAATGATGATATARGPKGTRSKASRGRPGLRRTTGRPGVQDEAEAVGEVEYLEITDERDRPLMVMPIAEARRQSLRHRVVLVMLHDAEGRVYLQKRSANKHLYPGRWDLSATGHVRAGESREDAALRELREELDVCAVRLLRRAEIAASAETGYAHVTLYAAGPSSTPPHPNPDEVADGMYVDADELDALLEHYRDMLTPALVWAAERGDVFRGLPDATETPEDAGHEPSPSEQP